MIKYKLLVKQEIIITNGDAEVRAIPGQKIIVNENQFAEIEPHRVEVIEKISPKVKKSKTTETKKEK